MASQVDGDSTPGGGSMSQPATPDPGSHLQLLKKRMRRGSTGRGRSFRTGSRRGSTDGGSKRNLDDGQHANTATTTEAGSKPALRKPLRDRVSASASTSVSASSGNTTTATTTATHAAAAAPGATVDDTTSAPTTSVELAHQQIPSGSLSQLRRRTSAGRIRGRGRSRKPAVAAAATALPADENAHPASPQRARTQRRRAKQPTASSGKPAARRPEASISPPPPMPPPSDDPLEASTGSLPPPAPPKSPPNKQPAQPSQPRSSGDEDPLTKSLGSTPGPSRIPRHGRRASIGHAVNPTNPTSGPAVQPDSTPPVVSEAVEQPAGRRRRRSSELSSTGPGSDHGKDANGTSMPLAGGAGGGAGASQSSIETGTGSVEDVPGGTAPPAHKRQPPRFGRRRQASSSSSSSGAGTDGREVDAADGGAPAVKNSIATKPVSVSRKRRRQLKASAQRRASGGAARPAAAAAAPAAVAAAAPAPAPAPVPAPGMESRWGEPTGLSQQWGEVEFLLRKPMRNDADIEAAAAAAKDGLRFLDELKQLAASLGVLQGSLSRWLLPYDSNTPTLDQAAAATSSSATGGEFADRVTPARRATMTASAVGLRSLVRVKIADDSDLGQARDAARAVSTFFGALLQEAAKDGASPFEKLKTL